jgi:hypothetical protein
MKTGILATQVPFELGQCLGLLQSVRNMLEMAGLAEDADAFQKLGRELMLQVNVTMPKIAPTFVPYEVPK